MENLEQKDIEDESTAERSNFDSTIDSFEIQEGLTQVIFRFDDVRKTVYKAKNIMVIIRSDDTVIFQAHVKSRRKKTIRDHVKIKIEGFDSSGVRIFRWRPGILGISCGQDGIKQYSKRISGAYNNSQRIYRKFSSHRYLSC